MNISNSWTDNRLTISQKDEAFSRLLADRVAKAKEELTRKLEGRLLYGQTTTEIPVANTFLRQCIADAYDTHTEKETENDMEAVQMVLDERAEKRARKLFKRLDRLFENFEELDAYPVSFKIQYTQKGRSDVGAAIQDSEGVWHVTGQQLTYRDNEAFKAWLATKAMECFLVEFEGEEL